MDLELFNYTEQLLNNPLIDIKLIENKHLIFVKYTSELYYKYSIELIETLCKKSKSENKKLLFYTTLNYLLKILYNCGNTPCLNNFDLTILCAFSLGIKSIENRINSPSINGLKRIYPEKYYHYSNNDIKIGEIICLKLLNYNINILTSYECLFYLLNKINNLNLFDHCIQYLDNLVIYGNKNFIFKSPIDIAKDTIEHVKLRQKEKKNINFIGVLNNKEERYYKYKDKLDMKKKKVKKNNESMSTNSSSAINLSNYINNTFYSNSKNKSFITNNNFNDIYLSSERNKYSKYDKNQIKTKTKSNLIYIDNDNNNDNIILNTKNSLVIENINRNKNSNVSFKFNEFTKYINIRKDNKNDSSPKILKKTIKICKKNLKSKFEEQIPLNKTRPILLNKEKNSNNNLKNNGVKFRNVNNSINFNYDKLSELCKKMNFDAFENNNKLNI